MLVETTLRPLSGRYRHPVASKANRANGGRRFRAILSRQSIVDFDHRDALVLTFPGTIWSKAPQERHDPTFL